MNAILQALLQTKPLQAWLNSHAHFCNLTNNDICLFCIFIKFYEEYKNSNDIISPKTLFKNLKNISESFAAGEQEDANYFITAFLNKLISDDNSSFVKSIF